MQEEKELIEKESYIKMQNDVNMLSHDKNISEPASVMVLIHSTGIRPGSERETFGKVKAYGATTLEGRHVIIDENGNVRLQFVGKKGVDINIPVNNRSVAQMLISRKEIAGDNGKLFSVNDNGLRIYTKTLNGGGFKPKDFRTLRGTSVAMEEISKMSRATTWAEYKKDVASVSKTVAQHLGNTASVAFKSYINPFVWLNIKPH